MRLVAITVALALANTALAAEFKLGSHNFTLPDGFTIEVAAAPSLVPRPIEADFDEQGRLYVTDSSGSNDKVAKQLADKPHRILRLEDTDGDGVFDKSVVFADKMMFPEGAMWLDGSLYVSAPPSIWKLTDTNNDGVADVREEWFKGKSLGGCANDLHGPYLGPDGWIYWCKGGFERQTNILGNGKTFISRASHIYRARPDGSGLEPIMTGGMDNPVGLAWSPEGELFLSGTFFQHPGGGKRDGLIHVIYGGVYGKDHDVLDGHPRTGELLPIMTHLGPAAPAGLTRYESSVFGAEYQDNLFCAQFNLHKISRHVLVPDGSTFRTHDSDFLVSDNPDFHPTDVFEDADGSLLVIDTGGWYKLCCPTSQLPKPDVLGAIYRIRRKDAPKVNDPRGLTISWMPFNWATTQLPRIAMLLGDDRPFVARSAIQALVREQAESIPVIVELLKSSRAPGIRRNAVWALTRMDHPKAREALYAALPTGKNSHLAPDDTVVKTALYSIGLWRDTNAYHAPFGDSFFAHVALSDALGNENPAMRRVAAEALGRIGVASAASMLLRASNPGSPPLDRPLQHALAYALIELTNATTTAGALDSSDPLIRQTALIALDQMPGGHLKPEQVTPLLASTSALLKQTANWIISHHPEWAGALAGFLKERLAAPDLSDAERAELQQQFTQFIRDATVQTIIAAAARDTSAPPSSRLTALRVMAAARLKQVPPAWDEAIDFSVRGPGTELQRQAVLAARALPEHTARLGDALLRRGMNFQTPADIRLTALAARRGAAALNKVNFDYAVCQVAATNTVQLRGLAAAVLASAPLDDDQLLELARRLTALSPSEVAKLLSAYRRCTNEQVGLRLTGVLKDLPYLQREQVWPNLTNFHSAIQARADRILASFNTDAVKQKARLEELSLNLKSGDVRRGQAIFNSQKAACATCHAIGYLGGNLGPDLTKIGQIRTERDLLEAVVFPSASFVRSYEPMLVVTKSGDEHSGILRKDAPDEVVLGTGVGAEVRVARADIAEMRPGTVSVMPAGLDEQLTRDELSDLIAFLKATRW